MLSPRVVYFSPESPFQGHASYTHVYEIITNLRALGWQVDLHCPQHEGKSLPGLAARIFAIARAALGAMLARRPDAFYVRWHFAAFPVSLHAHLFRVPLVIEVNGPAHDLFIAWPATKRFRRFFTWLMKTQLHWADAIIPVTDGLAHMCREIVGGEKEITTIPNGVNPDHFNPDAVRESNPFTYDLPQRFLVFVGTMAPWQGIRTILAAVERPEWPTGVAAVFAGDGTERPVVEEAAARLPQVRYLGRLPYELLPAVMARADASLVCTEDLEGRAQTGLAPLKLFESLASGVPVIVTDLPFQAEIIRESGCGVVVPPGKPAACAAAVARLLKDEATLAQMRARAREIGLRHSWRVRGEATRDVLYRIVGEARSVHTSAQNEAAVERARAESPSITSENHRPKVMHVITGLNVGGAERMLVSYATSKRRDAPDTLVVSLLPGGYFANVLRDSDIPVIEMNAMRGIGIILATLKLAAKIRNEKPDVLQSWMYHADLLSTVALMLSGRFRRTRLYWGVRCSDMDTSKYRAALRFAIWACSRLSWLPDAIIANSFAGARVHRALGYRSRDFSVIVNGVDTRRFCPDEAARREVRRELNISEDAVAVVLVARRDPMKDHETFIKALDQLPDVIGILVGSDTSRLPERPNLRRLGVRRDVERIYAGCDIVALCSAFGEGFPNVLIEGMSAGLVPVVTDVGDCRIIVGGIGEVVPPHDSSAFAAAIERVVAQGGENLAAQGRRARARVCERYSLDRAVSAFDRIYKSLALR